MIKYSLVMVQGYFLSLIREELVTAFSSAVRMLLPLDSQEVVNFSMLVLECLSVREMICQLFGR